MKLFKPFIIALILSGIDYGYRSARGLRPEIIFFFISFSVFFIIAFTLLSHEEN